jgi:hypothetical protein
MISHGRRWQYAFRALFSLIFKGYIADDILDAFRPRQPEAPPAPAVAKPPEDQGDRAVQLLAILQRDGRLVDFLMEDLAGYADAQIGAAVRDVHASCRTSLARYITLSPLHAEGEGATVMVDRGVDAARIKVVGNVGGAPPYRGVLRHRGWDATRVELPPLPATFRTVVAPAVVEVL